MNDNNIIYVGNNGEVNLPKEIQGKLNINYKDPLEVYIQSGSVVLRKLESMGEFDKIIESRR